MFLNTYLDAQFFPNESISADECELGLVLEVVQLPCPTCAHSNTTWCCCLFAFSLEEINVPLLVLRGKGSGICANGHKSSAVENELQLNSTKK